MKRVESPGKTQQRVLLQKLAFPITVAVDKKMWFSQCAYFMALKIQYHMKKHRRAYASIRVCALMQQWCIAIVRVCWGIHGIGWYWMRAERAVRHGELRGRVDSEYYVWRVTAA